MEMVINELTISAQLPLGQAGKRKQAPPLNLGAGAKKMNY